MEEVAYLFLTILIEIPIALILLRQEQWQRVVVAAVCVNMMSHPIAWAFVTHGFSWWTVEGFVALFEGSIFALLFPARRYRAGLTAVVMNGVSALIGLLI